MLIGTALAGCTSQRLYISGEEQEFQDRFRVDSDSSLLYEVFLIGDTGAPALDGSDPVLNLLDRKLEEAGEQSAVVFLGDNVYPHGLPDSLEAGREEAEAVLLEQLRLLDDYRGRIVFIPGNHDWNSSRTGGLEALRRQEHFIETYLDRGNTFFPDDGFPGPVEVKLMDEDDHPALREDIRLVVLDTEWWMYKHEKPFGDAGDYEVQNEGDFVQELDYMLRDRRNDKLLVVGHHPLISNGKNGGYFPLKTHLLPPLFGTMYVGYRKFFGLPQDLSSYNYRRLRNELTYLFGPHHDLIYAAGHEHGLQYFRKEGRRYTQHFLVSGTGSMTDYLQKGAGAGFLSDRHGFLKVQYYADGSSWMEAWSPTGESPDGELLFRTRLGEPYADPLRGYSPDIMNSDAGSPPSYSDSTITIAAKEEYDRPGDMYRFFMGNHNRELWSIPVEHPVLDIGEIDEGLTPTRIGGKGQSVTLRLESGEGQEYVLRSVDKEAGRLWEDEMKNTLAHQIAQDQFSIMHPYGALAMPPLADAAGVYHTNPEIFYVPDDPRLGTYADLMRGELALLEERPDADMTHVESMGRSEEVISTRQMLLKVDDDNDHIVDQEMFARARLLDMLVADWDRHQDQWRWATFEPYQLDPSLEGEERTQGKIYRPIPRDRDAAFMKMDGLLPSIGRLDMFYQYQDFREQYGNLKGLTLNSLGLTRRFTNRLTRGDWMAIADSMQQAIDDEVIEEAVNRWPEPVVQESGSKAIEILTARRDQMKEVTGGYYDLLADVVDIPGSDKHEWFSVERLNGRQTRVVVEKRTKEGVFRKEIYRRTFDSGETREIRLYGMGGMDRFEVTGNHVNGIRIRVVGGGGTDRFVDRSTVTARNSRAQFYDTVDDTHQHAENGSNLLSSADPVDMRYDYDQGYHYDRIDPLLFLGSNTDDGLFVGGGAKITRHGFMKEPYARQHIIRGNVAAATGAYNLRYRAHFPEVWNSWSLGINADILSPNNIRNYYGLGNETDNDEGTARYYRARLANYRLAGTAGRQTGNGLEIRGTPSLEVTDLKQDEGRFIAQPQAGISENTFEDQWTAGMELEFILQALDQKENPKQGFRWQNRADINIGIRNTSDTYSRLDSELSVFYSPLLDPQLTVAIRFGAGHNIGSFPFYSANTLGGKYNLRGYRSTRFAGRSSVFNNLELRSKLFDFSNYILGGEIGLTAFHDTGRVWTDGESSRRWHRGYGGGIWFSIYNRAVVSTSIGYSDEGVYYTAGAGFFF